MDLGDLTLVSYTQVNLIFSECSELVLQAFQ